jgi:hypothetical protein
MTEATARQHHWTKLLQFYGEQNQGRPTRIGVFEGGSDLWLEDGLPLAGIDVDARGDVLTVEIILGDQVKGEKHFTHSVRNAQKLVMHLSPEQGDGIDIIDAEGNTLILRFEN